MQLEIIQSRVNTLVVKHNDSGSTSARLMNQKEYCLANELKGAEGKRQHKGYLRENGALLSGIVAAQATAGAIVAQKVRMSKSGDFHVTYVPKHKLESNESDKVKAAQSCADASAMHRAASVLASKLNCTLDEAKGYLALN